MISEDVGSTSDGMTSDERRHCGYVAIVGRPNVGKSTLLNHLIGQKISITADKPQTTRHTILGIDTQGLEQIIYVDTPGLHQGGKKALNRYLNKAASRALNEVDVVVFVVAGTEWRADDAWVLEKLKHIDKPIVLVINKVDLLGDKAHLLPHITQLSTLHSFTTIIPVSAKRKTQLSVLRDHLLRYLPEGPHLFNSEDITDKSERFLVAEIIREKLTRQLGEELPYAMSVAIDTMAHDERGLMRIAAHIVVERDSQKAIVIGSEGQRLKKVGQEARKDIETLLGEKIFLQLWVKVRKGWSDDEAWLQRLGYGDLD